MRRAKWVIGTAAALFLLLGSLPASATTYDVTMYITPAVGDTYAAMSCGWHESCASPYPIGVGIDWNDNNGTQPESLYTFFRVRSYVNSSGNAYVGSVRLKWRQGASYGNCNEVLAEVRRPGTFEIKATIRHLHVKRWDEVTYGIYGSSAGVLFSTTAGKMVDDSLNGCSWKGFHTHVWHISGQYTPVIRNTALPNANACGGSSACTGRYANPASQWDRKFAYSFTA
jgi:hypothetical protein